MYDCLCIMSLVLRHKYHYLRAIFNYYLCSFEQENPPTSSIIKFNKVFVYSFHTEKERTYAILAIIFGLLALIAIIVSGVSLSRPGNPKITIKEMNGMATGGGTSSSQQNNVGHAGIPGTNTGAAVWSIAVGHDHGAHEYM